jgi:ssDNA-binding Zn-finger/Zn-ribbon topoisomerase 1
MAKSVSIHVKCPLCKKSLMDNEHQLHNKPSIKLNIQLGDTRGVFRLCSIYGCYDHESDLDITGVDIAEFTCPHCNQILNSVEKCEVCDAPMVPFILDIGGKVAICSRKGCKNHYVAFKDPEDAVKQFYDEYGF